MRKNQRTLILGVGNILLRDEGFGVHVIQAMKGSALPKGVDLLDGGTAALDILNHITDYQHLIVIDAVQGGEPPGSIYRFTPDDLTPESKLVTSVHQIDLLDVLLMAEALGCGPASVVIFGVEPKMMGVGLELSPEIQARVRHVADLALLEIEG
jgi:hydrogenase maturation protease